MSNRTSTTVSSTDGESRIRRRRLVLAALGAVHVAVLFVGPLVTDEAGLIPIHDWTIAALTGLFVWMVARRSVTANRSAKRKIFFCL